MKKYNINNSPQKSVLLYKKITVRFARPICLQICYRLWLLKLMKWGGEGNIVTSWLFMEEVIDNITQCPLKEATRSFQSFISVIWVSHRHCKMCLFQVRMGMYLNHNSPFNSGDVHSSVRVCLLKWWSGILLLLPSREHSCCQFKDFFLD